MLSAIFIGLGFSSDATARDMVELIAKMRTEAPPHDAAQLFTLARKKRSAALAEAAQRLGLTPVFLDEAEMQAREAESLSRGAQAFEKLREKIGLASVAEAAALIGGGPDAVLIAPRRVYKNVTCALAALSEEMPS